MVWIVLATEDELSEQVGLCLANEIGLEVGSKLRRGGNGYLRSRIPNFCQMAHTQPVLLITDLDRMECPTVLMREWFGQREKPPAFLFRVAVREIESWLLADHDAMRGLLGPKAPKLPDAPDNLADAKQELLRIARRAPRDVRDDLVVQAGTVASQGLGYNARLCAWVRESWDASRAAERSPSLQRARTRLRELLD